MNSPTTKVPFSTAPQPVFVGAGMTHRGRVRDHNEDAILTDPGGTLWVVADGMGGHGHGDMASDMVIDHLSTIGETRDPAWRLKQAFEDANRAVREAARARGIGTMGSTAVAALLSGAVAHVAWVGDSRAYLMRGGQLRMITHDHSVVQDLVDSGRLTADEAEHHPEAHVITRAIGGEDAIEVDVVSVLMSIGDRLLLCSDGLTRCVFEQTIAETLRNEPDPEKASFKLVEAAMERGAPDNVSAIVVLATEG